MLWLWVLELLQPSRTACTYNPTQTHSRDQDPDHKYSIPIKAFNGNAGVQLLAFACASAGAAIWVMWCTRNSAHVSSTYSLVSSIAGVGVAAVGAKNVEWGWSKGSGLGAIFAGLCMAPVISACFAATIFMLIKVVRTPEMLLYDLSLTPLRLSTCEKTLSSGQSSPPQLSS